MNTRSLPDASSIGGTCSCNLLDACAERVHRVHVFGYLYHPYHMATDAGTIAIVAFSAWFIAFQPGLTVVGFVSAFAATQAAYWFARVVKQRVLGIVVRSFLQDTVLFILPSFAVATIAVGNDIAASMDLAGLDLALGLAFIRIGCFLGGCCYGRPARWGVLYRPEHLTVVEGWRTYSCGPIPSGRVVPIQLFEAAFSMSAFAALLAWRMNSPNAQAHLLLAFLLAYGCWRFVTDFWRETSARPRLAGLSEAQWVSAIAAATSALVLVFMQISR